MIWAVEGFSMTNQLGRYFTKFTLFVSCYSQTADMHSERKLSIIKKWK